MKIYEKIDRACVSGEYRSIQVAHTDARHPGPPFLGTICDCGHTPPTYDDSATVRFQIGLRVKCLKELSRGYVFFWEVHQGDPPRRRRRGVRPRTHLCTIRGFELTSGNLGINGAPNRAGVCLSVDKIAGVEDGDLEPESGSSFSVRVRFRERSTLKLLHRTTQLSPKSSTSTSPSD